MNKIAVKYEDELTCGQYLDCNFQDLVSRKADHSRAALADLLHGLLRFEPSERLTAQEALEHPFFRNPT